MAKKNNSKVSITSVDKLLKSADRTHETSAHCGEAELAFEVKSYLSSAELSTMLDVAVESMFHIDEKSGEECYDASFEGVAKAYVKLVYVANFKAEMSFDLVEALIYQSDVMDAIAGHWSAAQQKEFDRAFDKQVSYRKDLLVAGERAKLARITQQLDIAAEALMTISNLFSDIPQDSLSSAIDAIANISKEDLINGVVQASEKPELQVVK